MSNRAPSSDDKISYVDKTMPIQVVSVELLDKAELLDLMSSVICSSVTQDVALQTSYIDNVAKNLYWWAANPASGCHLKAVDNQTIVGVVLVKNFWNLCSLFVVPEYHRQGIGRALMMAAIEECREKSERKAIHLNVAANAIPFYQAIGFIPRESKQSQPVGVQAMQFLL